jgi:transposase
VTRRPRNTSGNAARRRGADARRTRMKIQRGLKKDSSLRKFVLGAHPIIEHFIGMLRLREIIGTYVRTDKRMRLDDDKVLALLIHNILTTPNALYEMEDWLGPLDPESVGLAPREYRFVQDDRIGRALARFYDSRHKDVFLHLALRAIKIFDLDCSRIHHDTTSVTFAGRYSAWNAGELAARGHNKDHRPDLKQLVLGLNVTADGAVPISHRIYSGNQTDDRLHPGNHRGLQKLLERVDFVYVADCKLATEENLQKISVWGGRFVSVMPRSWGEDGSFRERVRRGKVRWKHVLSRRNNRKPDSKMDRYYAAEGQYRTSRGYRLHWIRSTQKAEQDAEARLRRIEQTLSELRSLQPRLNTYNLKGRKQIAGHIEGILERNCCETLIRYEIHATRQYKRVYQKKGRPTKDTPSKITWREVFSISFGIDEDAVNELKKTEGVFPLITNLDPETHSPKRILEIYKFQPFLEKRFSQIKTYHEIAPVYLKNGKRVVAFLHMHVMALMVAALVERKLRLAMKRERLASLPIYPEKRLCKSPTIFDIVRLFRNVERYEVEVGGQTVVFPAELDDEQKLVLDLLEVPRSSYQ